MSARQKRPREALREENVQEEVEEANFGDAMQKILSRPLGDKNPVLAKRRTTKMKQRAMELQDQRKAREATREKKMRRKRHMVLPGPEQQGYERELRKVATRGVVALFNAVRTHQKTYEAEDEQGRSRNKKKKVLAADSKLPSEQRKDQFLDMLKRTTGIAEGASASSSSKAARRPAKWAALHDGSAGAANWQGEQEREVAEEAGDGGDRWGMGMVEANWLGEEEDEEDF